MIQPSSVETTATFYAFVDAIIPNTPNLATTLGPIYTLGATDLDTYAYLIYQLDHAVSIHIGLSLVNIPLAQPTAELLNTAAQQVIETKRNIDPLNSYPLTSRMPFAMLSRTDRLRTVSFLEQLDINLARLPVPFQYNGGLVQNMMDVINRLTYFGFFSEWAGYGTTRLLPPVCRRIEFFPPSWIQAGYPGPVYGYRDLRGFLLKFPRRGDENNVT